MSDKTVHNVPLTEEEILAIESALYDRASVLFAVARQLEYSGNKEQARIIEKRGNYIEFMANKVAMPIDQAYLTKVNKSKETANV